MLELPHKAEVLALSRAQRGGGVVAHKSNEELVAYPKVGFLRLFKEGCNLLAHLLAQNLKAKSLILWSLGESAQEKFAIEMEE